YRAPPARTWSRLVIRPVPVNGRHTGGTRRDPAADRARTRRPSARESAADCAHLPRPTVQPRAMSRRDGRADRARRRPRRPAPPGGRLRAPADGGPLDAGLLLRSGAPHYG